MRSLSSKKHNSETFGIHSRFYHHFCEFSEFFKTNTMRHKNYKKMEPPEKTYFIGTLTRIYSIKMALYFYLEIK